MRNKQSTDLLSLLKKCTNEQLVKLIFDRANEDEGFRILLEVMLAEADDADSILSNFKAAAEKVFAGDASRNLMIKAAEKLYSQTDKIGDTIVRIRIYADLLRFCDDNLDELYNTSYDNNFIVFEVLEEAREMLEAAVELIVEDGEQRNIEAVWEILTEYYKGKNELDGEDRFLPSLRCFAKFPQYKQKIDSIL